VTIPPQTDAALLGAKRAGGAGPDGVVKVLVKIAFRAAAVKVFSCILAMHSVGSDEKTVPAGGRPGFLLCEARREVHGP
jgi:hypothetical protein